MIRNERTCTSKKCDTETGKVYKEVYDLRGADDPPLVLAPVHTQHLIPVSLQSSPCLHNKLAQAFHLLGHLMHWTNKRWTPPDQFATSSHLHSNKINSILEFYINVCLMSVEETLMINACVAPPRGGNVT